MARPFSMPNTFTPSQPIIFHRLLCVARVGGGWGDWRFHGDERETRKEKKERGFSPAH